jgi:hypothetical protein
VHPTEREVRQARCTRYRLSGPGHDSELRLPQRDWYGVLPFQALLKPGATGPGRLSKAHADRSESIDVRRLGPRIGQLPPAVIAGLDKALRLHLGL